MSAATQTRRPGFAAETNMSRGALLEDGENSGQVLSLWKIILQTQHNCPELKFREVIYDLQRENQFLSKA